MRGLCISTHDFDSSIRVGSHYFAKYFSSLFEQVEYVSSPLTPLNILRFGNAEDSQRLKRFRHPNTSIPLSQKRLFSLFPVGPLFPFDEYWYLRNFHYLLFGSRPKNHYRIVYIDNFYLASLLDTITYDYLVVRVPDVFYAKSSSGLKKIARETLERANVVISVSEAVKDELECCLGIKSYIIGNGVDISRFPTKQKTLINDNRKNIIFVGVFGHWVDTELMARLIETFKDVKVTLIGPISSKLKSRFSLLGAECTGIMSPEESAERMSEADVGIIPFDIWWQEDFVAGISPLKAFEYLAAGIPVVASEMAALNSVEGIELAKSHNEFIDKVRSLLASSIDSLAIMQSAEKYSWNNRFIELERIMAIHNIKLED